MYITKDQIVKIIIFGSMFCFLFWYHTQRQPFDLDDSLHLAYGFTFVGVLLIFLYGREYKKKEEDERKR